LRRRATRAGLNNIQTVPIKNEAEAEVIDKFKATANVVLVDAPCSGWGVLRRNPDIKWRQQRDILGKMPVIQLRLLSAYSRLVAPGGRLVFGVCTFRKDETIGVIEKFLALNPDFKLGDGGFLGPGPCDGFFMQSMERR
jgi:16S rRNA (cytosine967-C5)-methyltransferase